MSHAIHVLHSLLTVREQAAITKAALLAHKGQHAEAEASRFAGGYHNLPPESHAARS